MPGFNGVAADPADGARWELTLSLLASGQAPIRLGGLQLWRDANGPDASGVILVTTEVPEKMAEPAALGVIQEQRDALEEVAARDERFAALLTKHGCRFEVVHNYGMGTSLLASAEGDDPRT
jgi:hypothetical protein